MGMRVGIASIVSLGRRRRALNRRASEHPIVLAFGNTQTGILKRTAEISVASYNAQQRMRTVRLR
jgi:hypothetical protein